MTPADQYIPAKEVAAFFNYPTPQALNNAVARGEFPQPDRRDVRDLWMVKTMHKEWKRSGMLGEIPPRLQSYVDYDAWLNDMKHGGVFCFVDRDNQLYVFSND